MSRWIDGDWLLNFFEPYPDDYQTPLGTLRACIDDAPTIEPKRGEWSFTNGIARCPYCGYSVIMVDWRMNFCPNCGARMKGADDE